MSARGVGWLLAGVGLALGAGVPGAPGQEAFPIPVAPKVPSVLFVGNSFCHGAFLPVRKYNNTAIKDENFGLPPGDPRAEHAKEDGPFGGIPGIFKKLTDEAGVPYDVHIEAVSAKPLAYHYEHALPVIARAQWTAVVLQGYSTEALPEGRGGKPEDFRKNATLLEQAVHAVNPQARVYLYATWPRADRVYSAKGRYVGEPVEIMAHDLHEGYYGEAAENGHFAGVAPVGDAWLRAIRSGVAQANPFLPEQKDKMDLWGRDDYHPSNEGAYLSALVLFQQITGKDARELGPGEQAAADLGIKPEDAAVLQRVASEQVNAGVAQPTNLPGKTP